MLSLRLKTIASLVDKNASVIDIGTDHAYVPIYLIENKIAKKVLATDISEKVIEGAIKNIKNASLDNAIEVSVTDGFNNIIDKYDIAIIAGMGTHTIKEILSYDNIPNTLIIQSNNNHEELRLFMNKLGYSINKEIIVLEQGIYYPIIKYIKKKEILTDNELKYGKSNDIEYYKYLLFKLDYLYRQSKKKIFLEEKNNLQKLIEKIQD